MAPTPIPAESATTPQPITLCAYAYATVHHTARVLAGRYGFTENDRQDIEQDLAAHVIAALPNYNPERASRRTFIARVISIRSATLIRSRSAPIRDYRRVCDIDGCQSDGITHISLVIADPSAAVEAQRRDLHIDLEATIRTLPEDLRTLCLQLQINSVSEIARTTGTPRWQIYESIARLREIFAHAGLVDYLSA